MDFLSHAAIVGFMGGAATVVCLQQLKSILGLEHFTHQADLVSVMRSVFTQTREVQLVQTMVSNYIVCIFHPLQYNTARSLIVLLFITP